MNKFEDLNVWKAAMNLVVNVYDAVSDFPKEEKYGLTSQIKRSAVSIPSNIAEGAGRNSDKQFLYFLSVANGSSYELQTQILLAKKFKMIEINFADKILKEIDDVQKMLYGLQKHLKK